MGAEAVIARALPLPASRPLAAAAARQKWQRDFAGDGAPGMPRFDGDASQFTLPQHRQDPPCRRISRIGMDGEAFIAKAILLETGIDRFQAPERGVMVTVARDGSAHPSRDPAEFKGTCGEETR